MIPDKDWPDAVKPHSQPQQPDSEQPQAATPCECAIPPITQVQSLPQQVYRIKCTFLGSARTVGEETDRNHKQYELDMLFLTNKKRARDWILETHTGLGRIVLCWGDRDEITYAVGVANGVPEFIYEIAPVEILS